MSNFFINLEDEIELRRALRAVYSNEGLTGIYTVMGELNRALQVTAQLALELLDEENTKGIK